MPLNESITKISPFTESSNGSSLDDLLVSWQIEEEIENKNPREQTTIFSSNLNWMDFLKLPLSSSDSDTSHKNSTSQDYEAKKKSTQVSLKLNTAPLTLSPLNSNKTSSIPLHTTLGIPSPQPKGIPRGHIQLPEWFEEPKNSADMPAFLKKLRSRYIYIHRRLHFLNNERLSLLSYFQSKFQNNCQSDVSLQSTIHSLNDFSQPLAQQTILNTSESQKVPMDSPHKPECYFKEDIFFDPKTPFQSNTYAPHNLQSSCSTNIIFPQQTSCLPDISLNRQSPLVLNPVSQDNFNPQNTATKSNFIKVKNSCKRNHTKKQQSKTKRQVVTTECFFPLSSTDAFPLSYWTSLPTNILRLWMSFFGMKSTKSSVSRSSIVTSLSKISQYISLDASNPPVC